MPVIVKSTTYTDNFGNSGSSYVSNAGDKVTLEVVIASQIRMSTLDNPFTFDPVLNVLTSPSQSWLDEGFRVGDVVLVDRRDSTGTSMAVLVTQVSSLTDTEMNFLFMSSVYFYDISAGESMIVTGLQAGVPTPTARLRADLQIDFNHSLNNETGNANSLIDGESTRIYFNDLTTLSLGATRNGSSVGNQSGQFLIDAEIKYDGLDSDGFNEYTLTLQFNNSGIYEQDWFALADCLKVFLKGEWSSFTGETFNKRDFKLDQSANTGWFNEANNSSVPTGGSVVSSVSELKYNVSPNTGLTFEVDLAGTNASDLGIGGAYVSINDSYYKNRVENQRNITYLLSTHTIVSGTTYNSNSGVDGVVTNKWGVEITSVTTSGGNATVTFNFIPQTGFSDFIDSTDIDDKLFYLWVRIGNTNHLVYAKQLVKELPVGGPLTMNSDYGFLDHSENLDTITGNKTGFSADTEDDIAYYGTFNLELNKTSYNGINLRVEAYNTVTEDVFTLQQTNFSFGGVTYQASSGKYLLNESSAINSELQTTSLKKNASVVLTGTTTVTTYEVGVYYPFLLNWKYWLNLLGVSTDFAPNENQNWEQYDNVGAWSIRFTVELDDDGLAFVHSNTLIDNPYDNSSIVNSSIELKKQSDNSVVTIIPSGELLFIESTHILTTGNWDLPKMWGMITVEPKESSPRSICSTIVPFDNNLSNPLAPISGLLCQMTYPALNTIVLKCKFDPSKIDTSNGVKITAKIKQGENNIVEIGKSTTNDNDKNTTSDELKILA